MQITPETFDEVSIGSIKATIAPTTTDLASDVFSWCLKNRITLNEIVEVNFSGYRYISAFGMMQSPDVSKLHGKQWGRKGNKASYRYYVDVPALLADILLKNTLENYMRANRELVLRELAKNLGKKFNKTKFITDDATDPLLIDVVLMMKGWSQPPAVHERLIESILTEKPFAFLRGKLSFSDVPGVEQRMLLESMLVPFIKEIGRIQERVKARDESYAAHARVWQLKKNIPLKHLRKMETTLFLNNYGVVELDADVDLEKFELLEQEWKELCEVFPIPIAKDHSFRIRKLGNYRADGLHFPYHKATCVDLDGITNFLHELAHQIDFSENGVMNPLSEDRDFEKVYDRYEECVSRDVERLPLEHGLRKQWLGTTKYNRDYYLRKTEVFARSFEIYLFHVLEYRCSFLSQNYDSKVYCKDTIYLEYVRTYFESIFPKKEPQQLMRSEEIREKALSYDIHPKTGQLIFLI